MAAPFVSIIVPVLNEAILLGQFLRTLRSLEGDFEIIVVDGGSSDGSPQIAESMADKVLSARRGRASQMNAGAKIARGEVLWFLHADLTPSRHSPAEIARILGRPGTAGGCFRLRFPRAELIYRVSDSLGNLGVRVFGFALGDHGIFCRREAFLIVGGYPDVPILEDAELYRRLNRTGVMRQAKQTIVSDPRTFEKWGRCQTTAIYFIILLLYVCGAPIRRLNQIYRRFHSTGKPRPWRTPVAVAATSQS